MTVGFVPYTNYANLLAGDAGATHTLAAWVTDTIKAILIRTDLYSVDLNADQDLADIPSGARVSILTLSGMSITAGNVDGTDLAFTGVAHSAQAVVFYKHTGTESTSTLIAYADEDDAGDPIAIVGDGGTKNINYAVAGLVTFLGS